MLWCGFCVLLLDCSFLVVWLVGLFCRLSVVWIDSCTGRTNKVDNQNTNKTNQAGKRKIGVVGFMLSEKMREVRGKVTNYYFTAFM